MKGNVKKKKKKYFDRYKVLVIIMVMVFLVLLTKLSYLQVINAEEYKDKANSKGTIEIPEYAPRGQILDCNGKVLATSVTSYVLVYNPAVDDSSDFYSTMGKVFSILDENKESLKDDFQLKINPFRFEFNSDDENVKKSLEIRFKRDRGLNEVYEAPLLKNEETLTDDQINSVNNQLLKITPEDVFYKLVKQYDLYKLLDPSTYSNKNIKNLDGKQITELLLKKYSLSDIRRYIIIKDTIKMQSFSGYKPVIIANNIQPKTAFIILQKLDGLPGIDVNTEPLRYYPNGELGSAFLGYISKINGGVADKYDEKGYDISTDYVGMAGLESAYEDRLKGSKGGKIVKVNNQGRVIEELGTRESYPGQTLQLTIDKNIQAVAEKSLDDTMKYLQGFGVQSDGTDTKNATRGAVVVEDVNTGAILALVSRPGFNPNDFSTPGVLDNKDIYNKYFNPDYISLGQQYIKDKQLDTNVVSVDSMFPIDPNASTPKKQVRYDKYDVLPKPMYNYATMGLVQPGSTFKPLAAIAALEEGVLTPTDIVDDSGKYTKNNFNGECWQFHDYGYGHGPINVVTALQVSCNYFFFDVGDRLMGRKNDVESDTLAKYAWKFGLGVDPKGNAKKSTGIEIAENFGNVSNLEDVKTQIIFYRTQDMIADLKKSNIDLVVHTSDSEDVRQIKNDILTTVKNKMLDTSIMTEDTFSKKLRGLFNQLISKSPDLKGKITSGDIGAMVTKILYLTYDANGQIYTPSNVYSAAIGQGFSSFTPLQLVNYISTVVNGGKRYKLHLVDKFLDPNGQVIEQVKPEVIEDIHLKPETVSTVLQGLAKVTETGTASSTFINFPISNGGKTGSATFQEKQHDEGRESFGVYIGFAPLDHPKIAVCIVVYDGAHGNNVAPVARAIYETYFKNDILKLNPDYKFMYPIGN